MMKKKERNEKTESTFTDAVKYQSSYGQNLLLLLCEESCLWHGEVKQTGKRI
jgi:hypothetical protein